VGVGAAQISCVRSLCVTVGEIRPPCVKSLELATLKRIISFSFSTKNSHHHQPFGPVIHIYYVLQVYSKTSPRYAYIFTWFGMYSTVVAL
jgi:hypothetical protein